jgi:hypothetical protein
MELVNPKIPSTVEAGALCKMADRGQITGAIVDGPLALDNAISLESVRIKAIDSPVAGRANVLVVPDLEAGNMLAKSLSFLAGADAAGIVLGARVPIVLTSRADALTTKLASCAVALAGRARAPRSPAQGARLTHERRDRGAERGVVEHQVLAVRRACRRSRAGRARHRRSAATSPRFVAKDGAGAVLDEKAWGEGATTRPRGRPRPPRRVPRAAPRGPSPRRIGHRVVHGGREFAAPVEVDAT